MTTTIGYVDTVLANAKYAGPGTATAPTGTQKGYDAQLPETQTITIFTATRRKGCQYTFILHRSYLHIKITG